MNETGGAGVAQNHRVRTPAIAPIQASSGSECLRFARCERRGSRNLPVIQEGLNEPIVRAAQAGHVVNIVDRKDVRLIEIGHAFVKESVGTTVVYVAAVVVLRIVKGFRIRISHTVLEAMRIPPVDLNL